MKRSTLDLAFCLLEVRPFEVLGLETLIRVAEVAGRQDFAAGEIILSAGAVPERAYVLLSGEARRPYGPCSAALELAALLLDLPVATDIAAGDEGCSTAFLSKSHLFTIAREFPEMVVALNAEESA